MTKLFDVDGDGEIDRWELSNMLNALGSSLSDEETEQLVFILLVHFALYTTN